MKTIIISPVFLTLLSFSNLLGSTTETILSPHDFEAIANSAYVSFNKELENAPADITLGLADIKYNHGTFKIIECGNGQHSGIRRHSIYINNKECTQETPYWSIIEHLLNTYKLPVWFVGQLPFQSFQPFLRPPHDKHRPSTFDNLIAALGPDIHKNIPLPKPKTIREHTGIVLYRAPSRNSQQSPVFSAFSNNFLHFVLINSLSSRYFHSKDATYRLFEDAGLHNYIPDYAIYPARYNQKLAQEIIARFPSTAMFIIKPLNQSRARGVSVVAAENLNTHLQHLFGTTPFAPKETKSIGYWRTSKDTHCIISEFVPSQKVTYENIVYEPTMRIIFLMTHECGKVTVHILGGCWKVPPYGITDDSANLTEQYATNPDIHGTEIRVIIEEEELTTMKDVVAPVLAQAYKTILKQSMEHDGK